MPDWTKDAKMKLSIYGGHEGVIVRVKDAVGAAQQGQTLESGLERRFGSMGAASSVFKPSTGKVVLR